MRICRPETARKHMRLTDRLRFRDARPRPIAAPPWAAHDRPGVSEPSWVRAIMAAAVYTISSSLPSGSRTENPSGSRVTPGPARQRAGLRRPPHEARAVGSVRAERGCGVRRGGGAAAWQPDAESASGGWIPA